MGLHFQATSPEFRKSKMKTRLVLGIRPALVVWFLWLGSVQSYSQSAAFTYQGQLVDTGGSANGNYEFQFSLFDALTGGNPVGTVNALAPVAVKEGLFTATLDFGSSAFDGKPRWLQIGVRTNGSVLDHVILTPRQPITASPYAIFAANVPDGSITSAKIANGAISNAKLGPISRLSSPDGNLPKAIEVNNDGKVGIGVGTPADTLDVGGRMRIRSNEGTAGIYLQSPAGIKDRAFLGLADEMHAGFFGSGIGWGFVMDTANGNVGIGAVNPHNKLTVESALGTDDYISSQHSYQLQIQNGLGVYGSRSMGIGLLDNGKGVIQVKEANAGYNDLLLNPYAVGNVGIGTGTPAEKLDVGGAVAINGTTIINAQGQWVGSPSGLKGDKGDKGEKGDVGPRGARGDDGKTILHAVSMPGQTLGKDGDIYIDEYNHLLYGPKSGGDWGSPISLVGPRGPAGPTITTYAICQDGGLGPFPSETDAQSACNSRCGGASYRMGFSSGDCRVTSDTLGCSARNLGEGTLQAKAGLCCVCKAH